MNKADKNTTKHIVVIGGGFAGLNFVKHLAKKNYYNITLVDKNNYNHFTPLVYQVATGFLDASNISYPFRKLFRNKNIRFHLGELLSVSHEQSTCYLSNGEIKYDYLVFATGSISNFFGNINIQQYAIPMKTLNDALNMKNVLLQSLEAACNTNDVEERNKLLTVVVAGGGPTGVEVCGMLGEMKRCIIPKDYPELKEDNFDIYIVDGSPSLLNQMSEKSQRNAYSILVNLGVKIILQVTVHKFVDDEVELSNGIIIKTKNLVWAAGVTAAKIDGLPASSFGKGNRLVTNAYNRLLNVENIFAIGDACLQTADLHFPNGHPLLAQPAIQQGRHLARNFIAMANGHILKPFVYNDKGVMAIIGGRHAVVDLAKPKAHIKGFAALFIWLFIHLISLVAFDNKLKTVFNWLVSFLTKDQSLRMIIRPKTEQAILSKNNIHETGNAYQQ